MSFQSPPPLGPWEKVQLSRHPLRPYTLDYIGEMCSEFVELHGDRAFADDSAIVGGLGRLKAWNNRPVLLLGHQKGRGTKETVRRNFGMPRPEGYRKARRLMELGARFALPIVTFIDTPGAFPGIDAEERGQAEAIAANLEIMALLPVPICTVVIGEGGSGGALAIGVCDRLLMLEHAIYSVISPEGCASILWKDQHQAEAAAAQMKLTAADLQQLGVLDEVLAEPLEGAHKNFAAMAQVVSAALSRHLHELEIQARTSSAMLLQKRYEKYRAIGRFATQSANPTD